MATLSREDVEALGSFAFMPERVSEFAVPAGTTIELEAGTVTVDEESRIVIMSSGYMRPITEGDFQANYRQLLAPGS